MADMRCLRTRGPLAEVTPHGPLAEVIPRGVGRPLARVLGGAAINGATATIGGGPQAGTGGASGSLVTLITNAIAVAIVDTPSGHGAPSGHGVRDCGRHCGVLREVCEIVDDIVC